MKIKLCGVRGSFQTSDAETKNFGTRTSCTMVLEDGELLILDAGTGIQHFDSINFPAKRVDILLTHLHMDHILGLGFFSPFFIAGQEVHIWGPKTLSQSLRSRLSRYLSPPLFPVLLRDLPCNLSFHEIGNSEFEINHFKIKSNYIIHPGPTIGFRVTGNRSVFTYMPDHEPALGPEGIIKDPKWISGFDLALNADILYHDGQYTAEEYEAKKGWGHSCIADALQYASLCKVEKILLAHHDPSHSDEQLTKIFINIQENYNELPKYEMAKEGSEIDLP
jgi:ribonuclease BN (tRNA processing enzyme)